MKPWMEQVGVNTVHWRILKNSQVFERTEGQQAVWRPSHVSNHYLRVGFFLGTYECHLWEFFFFFCICAQPRTHHYSTLIFMQVLVSGTCFQSLLSKRFAVKKKTKQNTPASHIFTMVNAICCYEMKRNSIFLSLNIYLALINDNRMM